MKALAVFLLLLGIAGPARAGDLLSVCDSKEQLNPRIESCTDNHIAYDTAQVCHDRVMKAWADAKNELAAVMSVAQANLDTKQQADFLNSHSDLQKAVDKLQSLIDLTKANADVIAEYPRIMWDNNYAQPGLVRSSSCFKENFLLLQNIVTDLDTKTKEGRVALAATDKLRGISQNRDDLIRKTLGDGLAGKLAGVGSGTSQNGASDVTGVLEDAAKRKAVPATGATAKLDAPAKTSADAFLANSAPGKAATQEPSSITKRDPVAVARTAPGDISRGDPNSNPANFHTPGLGARLDPSGVFSARGSLDAASGVKVPVGNAVVASADDASIGAVLWKDTGGDEMKIGVPGLKDATDAVSATSASQSARLDSAGLGRGPASLVAIGAPVKGSRVVASSESDLFALVSSRYRATELFRHAR